MRSSSEKDFFEHMASYDVSEKTANIFHAHDVFIFDVRKKYLGRICQRSVCPQLPWSATSKIVERSNT